MKPTRPSPVRRGLVLASLACAALTVQAQAPRDVHVALSFFASAEHGGYYAAQAEGIYAKHGLNVKITQVGPQGNNMQLMVSGKADFVNGWSMRALNAVRENIPLVSVAALFQRDPQCKWYLPFMRKSQINYPSGLIHSLVTCATPIDDGTSMLCQWIYRNDTEADVSAADCIALDRRITDEDIGILEGLDPDVPLRASPEEEVSMYTDRPGIAMRKRLLEMLTAHGETEVRSDRNRRRWPLRPVQSA